MSGQHPPLTINRLFPTLLGQAKLANCEPLNRRLRDYIIQRAAQQLNEAERTTVNHGWQSPLGFHRRLGPEFQVLKDFFQQSIQVYLQAWGQEYGAGTGQNYEFDYESWAVLLRGGGFQHQHVHSRTKLVGVYYVAAPDRDAGDLCLVDPRPGRLATKPSWEMASTAIRPVPGTLSLFPSFVPHRVEQMTSASERISINFDVFVRPVAKAPPSSRSATTGIPVSTFDDMYRGNSPPAWDLGEPQAEIVRLAEQGKISGKVLDLGCGSGENAFFLSRQGRQVVGVDYSTTAIETAQERAKQKRENVQFLVQDVLRLQELEEVFDCAIDSGLFHNLSDQQRAELGPSLASVLRPEGMLYLLCFSNTENRGEANGPRRVTQAEIHQYFSEGWAVQDIREARMGVRGYPGGARAWLAEIKRV